MVEDNLVPVEYIDDLFKIFNSKVSNISDFVINRDFNQTIVDLKPRLNFEKFKTEYCCKEIDQFIVT